MRDAGASWTEQPWWTYRFGPTSSGDPASCDGEAKIDPLDHAHLTLTPPALYGCVFSWAESRDGGVTWTQHDAPNPWDPPSTPLRPGASIAFGLTPSGSFVPPGEGIATRVVPTLPNPLTGEDQITSVVPISATRVLAGTEFGLVSMTMAEPLVLNTPTLVRTDGIVTCGFSDTSAVPPVGFRVQIERDGSPTGQDQLRPDTAPAGTYRCHARAVGPFGTISSTFSEAITVVPTPTEEPSETEGPRTDALSLTAKGLQVVGSLRLGTTARCGGVALASRVRVHWALKHGRRVMRVTRPALAIRRRLLGWRLRCSVVGPSTPTVSAWRTIPPA